MKNIIIWLLSAASIFLLSGSQFTREPFFSLYSNRIFDTGEKATVTFQANNLYGEVNFKVYQISDPVSFFSEKYFPRSYMFTPTEESQKEWLKFLTGCSVIRTWVEPVPYDKNRWFSREIDLGIDKSGAYIIEARHGNKFAFSLTLISPYVLITKQSKSQLLTYIIERKSGKPVPNSKIFVYQTGQKIAEGNSTKDGLFYSTLPEISNTEQSIQGEMLRRPYHGYSRLLTVLAEKDKHFIISDPSYYSWGQNRRYLIYTYTDRPVYRPSQEVFFKGIIRKKNNTGDLINIPNTLVKITIKDARGGEVLYDSLHTNENGTYHGKLTLADEPPLGTYQIQTEVLDANNISTFEVQEYKKPEYEVNVTFDKKQYAKGETINATIDAKYYFGSPVVNAIIEYQIYRQRYYRPWWIELGYGWLYEEPDVIYQFDKQLIATETATLDKEGRYILKYQTEKELEFDYTYTIQASVTDLSRRTISGANNVLVTRGQFTLTLQTDKYVYQPNDDVRLTIDMRDFDDNGIENDYQVTVTKEWWDRIPRIQGGATFYDYKHGSETIIESTGKTDKTGRARTNFRLKTTGHYKISVSANDKIGNTISEVTQVYAAEKNMTWYGDISRGIQIIPDKQSYKVGETIRAFIVLPIDDIDVLITSEGENLIDYKIEHFNNNVKIVSVPIKNSHAPNFHIGVTAFRSNNLYQMTKQIVVIPQEKFLNVEIIPEKKIYKPSEKGSINLRVTDEKGNPVKSAELSVGIVDESIYAISSEKVPDIKKFFYSNRPNLIQTHSSIYFNFYSYAQTDVLQPMEVGTTDGQRLRKDGESKLEFSSMLDEKKQFVEAVVRKDFRDAMYWMPDIRTDEKGTAKINVTYPDNLTTWRTTVRAITNDTKVGSAIEKVTVRKNLLVRTETPRFLTQRDTTTISVIVHNYLNQDKIVKVSLNASGAKLLGNERNVTVLKNGEARMDWKLVAVETGKAVLTAKALTDTESDAMEVNIPILPHGIQLAQTQVVDLQPDDAQKSFVITIPEEAEISSAKLTVNLSPSLASSILTALDDLIGYPYGCVEQTMNRFLPTIVIANLLQEFDAPIAASKKAELPKMVETGLQRLYALQHQDGGWGWWEQDNTDAFMTSYVIYGLTLAKVAGYQINSERLKNGISKIQYILSSSDKLDPTTAAYAIYVLSFAGVNNIPVNKDIIESRLARIDVNNANNYTRSLAALANYYNGDNRTSIAITRTLEQSVTHTGTAAFWSGRSWQYNWQDDNVETTAMALKALLAARGDSELVQKAVHFLLKQKQGNSWMSTKQTAIVIFALVDYLKTSKELQPDYTANIIVNDKLALTKHITKSNVFDKEPSFEITNEKLNKGINTIKIEKTGEGKLYTTAQISYYSKEEDIKSQQSGFSVEREYYKLVREFTGTEYIYKKIPLNGIIKPGEELFVKISIASDGYYEYFMLEDPLIPGAEVVKDVSGYKITDEVGYEQKQLYMPVRWWWASKEVKDEKVAFFARNISGGTYTFSYILRAQIPGSYHVMPAIGSLMYYPDKRGNSDEKKLIITE